MALVWLNSVVLAADLYRDLTFGLVGGLVIQLALSAVFALMGLGVLRRWRWMFVLLMILFLVGGLSAAAGVIGIINYQTNLEQLFGTTDPAIAALAESQIRAAIPSVVIGFLTLAVGTLMFFGWRKRGAWGAF